MRKGRSQRKVRSSLPPLSTRLMASSVGPGGASSVRPGQGPQVVIGLTAPPSVEGADDVRDTLAREHADSAPTFAALREPEAHELPSERDPFMDALSDPTPEPAEVEASSAEPEPEHEPIVVLARTRESHVTALVTPDEMSIPPVGDLSVEPIAERFFSEGELAAAREAGAVAEEEENAADQRTRKSLPHVVERRQRFARYVRWAVAGAAVVCLAALVQTTMAPHRSSVAAPPAVVAVVPAPPLAEAVPVAEPVAKPPEPEPPSAAAEAPPVAKEAPPVAAKPDMPAPAPGDKTALQEKNDARRSLERGKLADAIAAGERSVALDSEDGEAWLLLGAAYQEKGNLAEARRAYTSCIKEGKRGPVGECRQMIR